MKPYIHLLLLIYSSLGLLWIEQCQGQTTTAGGLKESGGLKEYRVELLIRPTPPGDFLTQLLQAALDASKADNEIIRLQFSTLDMTQARWIAQLQRAKQGNQVIWTITDRARESRLRAIRVPLMRGLYGFRVLVIRPQESARFASINSLAQLAQLTAGLNSQWPDARVFTYNKLGFEGGTFAANFYRMLAAKRFDYFPRGILEITEEQAFIDQNQLQLEPQLLLYYPSALYFFVNRNNEQLARRLELGLQKLQASGTYDRLFYSHPSVRAALARMAGRRVIQLTNPDLPTGSQVFSPDYYRTYLQPDSPPNASGAPGQDTP